MATIGYRRQRPWVTAFALTLMLLVACDRIMPRPELPTFVFLAAVLALLDRHMLNLGVDVFVAVRTNQHNAEWFEKFSRVVEGFPEVVEFYRMSGEVDYLMRVVVPDIKAYDVFYKRLIQHADIADVSSSFAMEQIKYTTSLPLDYV